LKTIETPVLIVGGGGAGLTAIDRENAIALCGEEA